MVFNHVRDGGPLQSLVGPQPLGTPQYKVGLRGRCAQLGRIFAQGGFRKLAGRQVSLPRQQLCQQRFSRACPSDQGNPNGPL